MNHQCNNTNHLTPDEIESYVNKIHAMITNEIEKIRKELANSNNCFMGFYTIILNILIRTGIDYAIHSYTTMDIDIKKTIENIIFGIASGCEHVRPDLFNNEKKNTH